MSRKRGLRPEEARLWERVAGTARPMPARRKAGAQPAFPAAEPEAGQPTGSTAGPAVGPPLAPFRIGEALAPRDPGHVMQPGIAERIAGEPVRMDRKAFDRMNRGKLSPEGRLDLHGMTLAEAQPALVRFVLGAQAAGKRLVLVVTGKGRDRDEDGPIPARRGLLRQQVPAWLSQPPLGAAVLQVAEAHRRHGGGGAYYVYLRRPAGSRP